MSISTLSTDSSGRMTRMPARLAKMVCNGILIKLTDQYSYAQTAGGLILPGSDNDISDKKYRIGEIVQLGDTVNAERLHVGDIVVYLNHAAYRMPNGFEEPFLFKLTYNDMSIMAVLPNLDPNLRHESWNDHPFLADIEAETKQWMTGAESTELPSRSTAPIVAAAKRAAAKQATPAKKAAKKAARKK